MPVNLISRSSPWPVRPGFGGGGGGGALMRQGSYQTQEKCKHNEEIQQTLLHTPIVNDLAS